MMPKVLTPSDSHKHSLETLNQLFEYDDFMLTIESMLDLGCGSGLDLEWWANLTTRDEVPQPLHIKCLGVDLHPALSLDQKYRNVQYMVQDFEEDLKVNQQYDVIWCHDAFQYATNPLKTLSNWNKVLTNDGMLMLVLPQTTNVEYNKLAYDQADGCYFNWTLVSLIHALAVTGFDCRGGYFYKSETDPWLKAIVYKSEHGPMNPKTTRWYDLVDKNLLPESAVASINKYGYLRQQDLVLRWIDKSLHTYANH
jgi:SAM-dependent methyltransferase